MLFPLAASAQNGGISLGSQFPLADRSIEGVDERAYRLQDFRGERGTVIVFWSNNCPWVDKTEERLLQVIGDFSARGIGFALVNSNDPVAFEEESLVASRQRASQSRYGVPYLRDQGSQLARALGATRTPHFFIFDADNALVYSGALDDSPGDPASVQARYVPDALTALLEGRPAPTGQTKAFGCTIRFE